MSEKYYKWAVEGENVHGGFADRIVGTVFRFNNIYEANRWVRRSPEARRVTFSSNPIVEKARADGTFSLPNPEEIAEDWCCEKMRLWAYDLKIGAKTWHGLSFDYCPWCGEKIRGTSAPTNEEDRS